MTPLLLFVQLTQDVAAAKLHNKVNGNMLGVSESQLKRWLKEGKQLHEDWTAHTPLPKPRIKPRHKTPEEANLHEDIVAKMSKEVADARAKLVLSGGKRLSKEQSPSGTIARCRQLYPTWKIAHQAQSSMKMSKTRPGERPSSGKNFSKRLFSDAVEEKFAAAAT